ncbi:MAG: ABC transporter permease [Dehalococcoidia bacterium]
MSAYIARRLVGMLPTLALLVIATAGLVRLAPGNPVDLILQESLATQDQRADLEERLGLHDPFPITLVNYAGDLADGSLGRSLWDSQTVRSEVSERLPATVELALLAMSVAVAIGVPVGVLGAVRRNKPEDLVSRSIVLVWLSVPNFVLATAVVILPAVYWGWTPPLKYVRLSDDPISNLRFFILPSLILGTALSASIARFTRTSMLEIYRADFMRTARSRGLSERVVVWRHGVRNALIPVLTLLGSQIANVLGGSVVIEQVFGIPGLGRLLLDAISTRDYPVVQGIALCIGLIVLMANLVVDVCYVLVDPRIRLA